MSCRRLNWPVRGARRHLKAPRGCRLTVFRPASEAASSGLSGSSMMMMPPPRPVSVPPTDVATRLPRFVNRVSCSVSFFGSMRVLLRFPATTNWLPARSLLWRKNSLKSREFVLKALIFSRNSRVTIANGSRNLSFSLLFSLLPGKFGSDRIAQDWQHSHFSKSFAFKDLMGQQCSTRHSYV